MKVIAIDLWNKRVWIAWNEWNIAFPKEIVPRVEIMSFLKKYIQSHSDIDTIIVWLPYDLYGVDTRQLDKTKNFIEKLQDIFPRINITGHDERFSIYILLFDL